LAGLAAEYFFGLFRLRIKNIVQPSAVPSPIETPRAI
jgi:hypothetical protein